MKKITLFTILFVVSLYLSPLICAQMDDFPLTEEEQAYILAYTYLDTRFSMGGPETESEISRFKEIASTLSAAQREDLYDKYKYPTATTIGLNVLTGGLGSIINDDNKIPGLILQLCGSAGFGLVLWAQFSQDPDLDTILQWTSYGLSGISLIGGIVYPIIISRTINSDVNEVFR